MMQNLLKIILIWTLCFGASAVAAADVGALLNAERRAKGIAQLERSPKLTQAARRHAADMARRGFFSHEGSDGSDVAKRVRKAKYRFCFVAENIAKGQRSAEDVMSAWMKSPGHRRNNLSRKATQFGYARAKGNIWVLVLGRPGC